MMPGAPFVNFAFTINEPPKTGCSVTRPSSSAKSGHVRQHRAVETRGEPSRNVAPVIARGNEDRVGRSRAGDQRRDCRSDRHAGQLAADVAHVVERRRAVVAGVGGQASRRFPQVIAATSLDRVRAWLRSSSEVVVNESSDGSTSIHSLDSVISYS